ncbi:MAG: preprotein translocase subunit YajC [Candidatus Nanopelagicales bacterium]
MNLLPIAMLALLALAFWFLVLRPAKARQAAQVKLVNQIEVGQRVMTTAGMFGYVRSISDDEVGLEIAPNVIVQMLKPAVAKVVDDGFPVATDEVDDSASDQDLSEKPADLGVDAPNNDGR